MIANLFADVPAELPVELVQVLWQTSRLRVERIISRGHSTLPGEWYDQPTDEWVVLLAGGAILCFEGREEPYRLRPGDYLLLPAHLRHRVEWTEAGCDTIWLVIHVER